MHLNSNTVKDARLFERLTTTQYRVTDNRIMLLIKSWRQRLEHRLLREKFEGAESFVSKKHIVRNPELETQVSNQWLFVTARKWVAQPFPGIAFINGSFVSFNHRQSSSQVHPHAHGFAAQY